MSLNNRTVRFVLGLLIASTTIACGSSKEVAQEKTPTKLVYNKDLRTEESALLWQQTSAEYTALCYQAFNAAKNYLNNGVELKDDRHPSVIMDLDETVLDNSKYNGFLLIENQSYSPETWERWVEEVDADLVPGAKEFIDFVKAMGLKIFFISNRSKMHEDFTIQNLQKLGIDVNPENLFLKEETSEKIERRKAVMASHNVIMFVGDNLADFDDLFEGNASIGERKRSVKEMEAMFGTKFIILPNVMYGAWEKALEIDDHEEEVLPKAEGRRRFLRFFTP
jgi:5'-nucleotidase (lipoprotein e(P4) family)